MKALVKFYRPVQESLAHSHSLARTFSKCTKKKGCRLRFRPDFIGQFKKVWHIRTVSPELSLIALKMKGCRLRFRPNFIVQFKKVWHICAVSSEPSLVAQKRRDVP